MATGNSGDAHVGLSLDEWLLSRAHLRFVRQMMIDHIWTTRRAESKTSNPQRLPLLGNFNNSPSDECVALSTFVAISNGKAEKEGHGQTVLDPRSEVDSNATTRTLRSEDLRPAARKSFRRAERRKSPDLSCNGPCPFEPPVQCDACQF